MIGRRGFLSGIGAAFLCLNLGLRPMPAVARTVPPVEPSKLTRYYPGVGVINCRCVVAVSDGSLVGLSQVVPIPIRALS